MNDKDSPTRQINKKVDQFSTDGKKEDFEKILEEKYKREHKDNDEVIFVFQDVHKLGISDIWITDDNRFLISISIDQTIKIFGIHQKLKFRNVPIHDIKTSIKPSACSLSNNMRY